MVEHLKSNTSTIKTFNVLFKVGEFLWNLPYMHSKLNILRFLTIKEQPQQDLHELLQRKQLPLHQLSHNTIVGTTQIRRVKRSTWASMHQHEWLEFHHSQLKHSLPSPNTILSRNLFLVSKEMPPSRNLFLFI